MNFTKDFTDDYIKLDRLDLDWHKIGFDLATVSGDQTRNGSIIGVNTGDALSGIMNEYQRYGYTEHNTKIWKTTNVEPKLTFDWEDDIARQLPLEHAIVTVTRQDPGQILPWHQDRFFMLRKHHPQDPRPIWRFLVFLTPWKMGHFLQVADSMLHHWQQGDVVVWHPGTEHLAANVGFEQKWTANVTGFLTV